MIDENCIKPEHSELGKKSEYDPHYNPSRLLALPRKAKRDTIGVDSERLPFYGFDRWNHYEVSWLNEKGKPIIAVAEIEYDCDSKNIIESKSMKLYFNSLNATKFKNAEAVQAVVRKDLEERLFGSFINVRIIDAKAFNSEKLFPKLDGFNIDDLDIECSIYKNNPEFLITDNEWVEEVLYSDLLKSNCLITNQPDWCSVQIAYRGKKINHAGLLRYIVSFRDDNEFHEQCIEKIFMHIMQRCAPEKLSVYGRSTRRGGVDINSIRSTEKVDPLSMPNQRLIRQ